MGDDQLLELRKAFVGRTFHVDQGRDGFYTVSADTSQISDEVAGKIEKFCVAVAIASLLEELCKNCPRGSVVLARLAKHLDTETAG